LTAEYDPIVRQYRRSKELPFRVYSEIPNHLESLGDLTGLAVLDVACGEGFYTRLIRSGGAARAVGVDISLAMIELARQQEVESPLGIEYSRVAAEQMPPLGAFDLVSTAFLFNTAPDQATLEAMARSLAANLKPGGRLVATLGDLCRWPHVDYRAYGMSTALDNPLPEGAPYQITFLLDDDSFTITDFAWSHGACEKALRAAGFDAVRWEPPTITADGITQLGEAFWQTYLTYPPVVRLEARRR
jgi:toxoflavin synthase